MATKVTLDRDTDANGEPSSFVVIRCRNLPIERFKAYREAIEGARFDRPRRANLAPLDKVPTILRKLREAEFPVDVEPALVRALQEHTAQQWLDLKGAQERATKIDAELKSRGMSLYPFQRTGVQWMSTRSGALLSDEMGLGKTIQAITALPASVPVLVVAPAVAKGVWLRELSKWRPQLRVSVLKGRDSFRWPEPGEVLVTNYDILPEIHAKTCPGTLPAEKCGGCLTEINRLGIKVKIPGHRKSCNEKGNLLEARPCPGCHKILKLVRPNTVAIVDEAHALKSGKARRTLRFRALSEAIREYEGRVWLLTATPLMNNPSELWNVYAAAGIAQEAFGTWKGFVSLFAGKSLFYGGYEWGTPEAEVAERIRRVALRRMRKEVLPELPEKTYRELVVDIDRKALAECDKYLEEIGGLDQLVALIEKDGIKFETMSKVRSALAMAKTPALMALIPEFEEAGEPLVVFSAHRFAIDLLKKRIGWRVITGDTKSTERTEIEEQFQRGELKGVACTIKAGGVSITLTRANQTIFVDRAFNPAENAQAEDRICRIGQTRGCIITLLIADHQLDIRLAELVAQKQKLITASVDAARVIETPTQALDEEQEQAIKAAQEEVRQGRVARRFAESATEKWAYDSLFNLDPSVNDRKLVTQLAEEAQSIGLSEAQWQLAIRVCKRYESCGKCPGEEAA
jgi:SWI/SNF-related matrix-associated actin-dependent regulator of chromatin subfamily A-like protein 1